MDDRTGVIAGSRIDPEGGPVEDPDDPLDGLSPSEQVAAFQKRDDWENARLGHAIALLNNHAPMFGHRVFKGETLLGQEDEGTPLMADVPPELKGHLVAAMVAAAKFAAKCFEGEEG